MTRDPLLDEHDRRLPPEIVALGILYAVLGALVVAVVGLRALFPSPGDWIAGTVLVTVLVALYVALWRQETGRSGPPDPRYYAPPPQASTIRLVDRPPYDWQREERRGTST